MRPYPKKGKEKLTCETLLIATGLLPILPLWMDPKAPASRWSLTVRFLASTLDFASALQALMQSQIIIRGIQRRVSLFALFQSAETEIQQMARNTKKAWGSMESTFGYHWQFKE